MENLREQVQYEVQNKAQKIRKAKRNHSIWIRIVTVLASITLFCTVYAMIMPAATESTKVYCGYEEYLAHTDDCYEKQLVLTCTNQDSEHLHDASCYEIQDVLVCERPIHEHTLQCYSNPCADRETEEEWERSFESAELTGEWSEDIVTIAKTQVGYKESKDNYYVLEDGETKNGYTRYGSWYGASYGDWDAMFCSFCLYYAGIPDTVIPYEASPKKWVEMLAAEDETLYRAAAEYEPVKGDLVFLDDDADGTADHVGIVTEVTEETIAEMAENTGSVETSTAAINIEITERTEMVIKTVEGDVKVEGDTVSYVAESRYALTDERILGYVSVQDAQTAQMTEATIECTTEDGARVTVTGNLPEGAEIKVSDVAEEVLAEIMEQVGADTPVFAYDITIIDGMGNEWQPETLGVKVSITGIDTETEDTEEIEVAHVPDEGEIEVVDSETTEDGVEFEANGFSVYVGYTVDFYYKNKEYSITGGTNILLSELFTQLGIDKKVKNVSSVTFTDTSLVSVTKSGTNDWLLTSLEPFTSRERLTITFKDGTTLRIIVKDAQSTDGDEVTTENPTTVDVKLNWKSTAPTSGEITVKLYLEGEDTGKTLTLNSGNSWSGQFTDLAAGTYSIEYSTIDGYEYSVTDTSNSVETSAGWTKADSLTSGNTYVLVHNTNKAVQNSSGTTLSAGTVTVSGSTITSTVGTAMQWCYNGTFLQNKATNYYLDLSSAKTSSTSQAITYSNSKCYYSYSYRRKNYTTNYYLYWNGSAYQTNTSSGTAITLYTNSTTTTTAITYTIDATATSSGTEVTTDESTAFAHNKTIDYLGDSTTNADTTLAGDEFYRLYLDMTGKQEPVDLLIVVDGSGSMDKTDMTINGKSGQCRDTAVTNFLNGSTTSSTSDGFIAYFLGLNSENKVSVIQFYGVSADSNTSKVSNSSITYTRDSKVLLDWTDTNTFVDCANQNNSGTNYEAGLERATNQFSKVSSDKHRKVMIFISDGVPTYFLVDSNDVGTVCNSYTLKTTDVGKRWGNGVYSDTTNYPYCKTPSKTAFDDFKKENSDVMVFTVGVSADISATSQSESQSPEVLQYMAEQGGGSFLSVTSDMSELKQELESIFYPKGVTITDNLSQYVRYYSTQPDVLVTMTKKSDNSVTTLYKNGSLTSAASGILTSVTYTAGDTADSPTKSTGTVSAKFNTDYQFSPEYTYTLSFNVKVTQTAVDTLKASGFTDTGDAGTDYGTNATSAGKSGFYSNTSANVSYNVCNAISSEAYAKPVIQVTATSEAVEEEEEGSGGNETGGETSNGLTAKAPDHYKYIDYLGDEADNPDTDVDDSSDATLDDLYRLYLDVGPETSYNPIDVLFIIDASSSMYNNSDATDIGGVSDCQRRWALDTLLNGKTTADTVGNHQTNLRDNGLISMIGNLNAENKIAIASFSSSTSDVITWSTLEEIEEKGTGYTYTNESGTNYVAGLQQAYAFLNDSEVVNDGHKKVMIFISDGNPTRYYNGLSGTTVLPEGTSWWDMYDEEAATAAAVSANTEFRNKTLSNSSSSTKISDMIASGDLSIYTIGVGDFTTDTLDQISTYERTNEDGTTSKTFSSTDFSEVMTLIDTKLTNDIGHYTDMKVTDTLSDYVDFYTTDLDFKIEKIFNTTKTTLYENGKLTTAGASYIKSDGVKIDYTTKTVSVDFLDTYEEEGSTIYRISFNVKTTQTAYDTYSASGYGDVKGDADTDYTGNETSSEKSGFYSNASAILEYTQSVSGKSGTPQTVTYPKPVIQVKEAETEEEEEEEEAEEAAETRETEHEDGVPDHYKYIDSFRDNTDNPDTDLDDKARAGTVSDLDDLYRLYLDIGPESSYEAIDVLFILDVSKSMSENDGGQDATDINGNTKVWRSYALDTMLNGEATNASPGSQNHQTTLYDNGLIGMIGQMNSDNKIAIATFSSTQSGYTMEESSRSKTVTTSSTNAVLEWTTCSEITSGYTYTNGKGTNYIAGLAAAKELLEDEKIANDGRKKIMIFISDGEPNMYYNTITNAIPTNSSIWGSSSTNTSVSKTQEVITALKNNGTWDSVFGDVEIYTIGVGSFATATLNMISTSGTTYTSTNFRDIMKDIDSKLTKGNGHYSDLTVTDTLSEYVDFYGNDLDLLVQIIKTSQEIKTNDGTATAGTTKSTSGDTVTVKTTTIDGDKVTVTTKATITLYTLNTLTGTGTKGSMYSTYIQSVSIDADKKTVTIDYIDNYKEEGDTVYRLSFNVKTTQKAYDTFLASGYGSVTGDKNTDYTGNTTSSEKAGFRANSSATLKYTRTIYGEDPTTGTVEFSHPVIQVVETPTVALTISKTVQGVQTEAEFPFELTVKDGDGKAVDLSKATLPTGVTLKSGTTNVLTFKLATGKSVTLEKIIPKGAKLALHETTHDGYTVAIKVGGESDTTDDKSFDVTTDTSVEVVNMTCVELPETGGSGIYPCIISGAILMLIAVMGVIRTRRRNERGVSM